MVSNRIVARRAGIAVVLVLVAALTVGGHIDPVGAELDGSPGAAETGQPVRLVRTIPTRELGLAAPASVTYRAATDSLIAAGRGVDRPAVVVEFTELDDLVAAAPLTAEALVSTIAIDPVDDVLTAESPSGAVVLSDPGAGPVVVLAEADPAAVAQPAAVTFDPETGSRYVLDRTGQMIVAVDRGGIRTTLDLSHVLSGTASGLAFDPAGRLLHVVSGDTMVSIDTSGDLAARYDLSSAELAEPGGMVFAPSADSTDEALSLYIADAAGGSVAELSLDPTVPVDAAPTAEAVSASLVRTYDLSALTPPSPDSAGVVYLADRDLLMVSDSEVNETTLYAGRNLFAVVPATGATTNAGNNTLAFSDEPTGVGYDPGSLHLFVSDDDDNEIFEVDAGGDGIYGNSDDTVTSIDTAILGSQDSEDVAYGDNTLYVVDGVDREVYVVGAGPNNIFDGLPANGGDDTASQFDVGQYGANDPEGIEYHAETDSLHIVDHKSDIIYETTTAGALIGTVDISAANPKVAAGVAVAPASDGSGAEHYYVVDRGVDNDGNPDENDGKMYELTGFGTAQCNGLAVTVDLGLGQSPTDGPDVILGTAADDVIVAGGGDDTVCGLGGHDTINGGAGGDWIDAGSGDDTAVGQIGDDTIIGGVGADQLLGFDGLDTISGGTGDDIINGGPGNDILDGGDQNDQIFAQGGDDSVAAGSGDDFVIGVDGADVISGGPGDDVLNGGPGSDTIMAGTGNDTVYGLSGDDPQLDGDEGADFIFGQVGNDTIDGGIGDDNLWGNEQDDTLSDPSGVNVLNGGPGDDHLVGGSGADQLFGDGSAFQAGDDTLDGGPGSDLVLGFSGDDTIGAVDGFADTVNGGPHSTGDVCISDAGLDVVYNCNP